MPTASQNSGTGFAAALSHTAMVLGFNRSVQKQGISNQLVGRATRKSHGVTNSAACFANTVTVLSLDDSEWWVLTLVFSLIHNKLIFDMVHSSS